MTKQTIKNLHQRSVRTSVMHQKLKALPIRSPVELQQLLTEASDGQVSISHEVAQDAFDQHHVRLNQLHSVPLTEVIHWFRQVVRGEPANTGTAAAAAATQPQNSTNPFMKHFARPVQQWWAHHVTRPFTELGQKWSVVASQDDDDDDDRHEALGSESDDKSCLRHEMSSMMIKGGSEEPQSMCCISGQFKTTQNTKINNEPVRDPEPPNPHYHHQKKKNTKTKKQMATETSRRTPQNGNRPDTNVHPRPKLRIQLQAKYDDTSPLEDTPDPGPTERLRDMMMLDELDPTAFENRINIEFLLDSKTTHEQGEGLSQAIEQWLEFIQAEWHWFDHVSVNLLQLDAATHQSRRQQLMSEMNEQQAKAWFISTRYLLQIQILYKQDQVPTWIRDWLGGIHEADVSMRFSRSWQNLYDLSKVYYGSLYADDDDDPSSGLSCRRLNETGKAVAQRLFSTLDLDQNQRLDVYVRMYFYFESLAS